MDVSMKMEWVKAGHSATQWLCVFLPAMQRNLAEFKIGETGEILSVYPESLRISLLGLGLSKGTRFRVSDMAPWSGPVAIETGGTKIALRLEDARGIEARPA